MAADRALTLDEEVCQGARATLTNPRARLGAEISWFPGVSPGKAESLITRATKEPLTVRRETGVPLLARANLLSVALESLDGQVGHDDLVSFILDLAGTIDRLDVAGTMRDINEDRAVSGFPAVLEAGEVEGALAERKRQIHDATKAALNALPTDAMVGVLTRIVAMATKGGVSHAPELVDLLVDSYEVAANQFLQAEATNIAKMTSVAADVAGQNRAALGRLVAHIDRVVRNWDRVAQPIQLNARARGLTDDLSKAVAFGVRALAVQLFNENNLIAESRQLTGLLQELFAEVPQVVERLGADSQALDTIVKERAAWARSITYKTEVGIAFKNALSISPDGVSWGGQSYPLDEVSRVRWGGTKHSINGIPTGMTYTIAFGDADSEAVVELRRQEAYDAFLKCLWRGVCVRLVGELGAQLKAGTRWPLGGSIIADDHIVLMRRRFLRASEPVACNWSDTRVGSADGSFVIASSIDPKASVALSYAELPNVHILEQLVQLALQRSGGRLSDALEGDDE